MNSTKEGEAVNLIRLKSTRCCHILNKLLPTMLFRKKENQSILQRILQKLIIRPSKVFVLYRNFRSSFPQTNIFFHQQYDAQSKKITLKVKVKNPVGKTKDKHGKTIIHIMQCKKVAVGGVHNIHQVILKVGISLG